LHLICPEFGIISLYSCNQATSMWFSLGPIMWSSSKGGMYTQVIYIYVRAAVQHKRPIGTGRSSLPQFQGRVWPTVRTAAQDRCRTSPRFTYAGPYPLAITLPLAYPSVWTEGMRTPTHESSGDHSSMPTARDPLPTVRTPGEVCFDLKTASAHSFPTQPIPAAASLTVVLRYPCIDYMGICELLLQTPFGQKNGA